MTDTDRLRLLRNLADSALDEFGGGEGSWTVNETSLLENAVRLLVEAVNSRDLREDFPVFGPVSQVPTSTSESPPEACEQCWTEALRQVSSESSWTSWTGSASADEIDCYRTALAHCQHTDLQRHGGWLA
jgi:hypothetical protein